MAESLYTSEIGRRTPELEAALRDAFLDWYGENANTIEGGGWGDVYGLFLTLNAACWKASISSSSNSIAAAKSPQA